MKILKKKDFDLMVLFFTNKHVVLIKKKIEEVTVETHIYIYISIYIYRVVYIYYFQTCFVLSINIFWLLFEDNQSRYIPLDLIIFFNSTTSSVGWQRRSFTHNDKTKIKKRKEKKKKQSNFLQTFFIRYTPWWIHKKKQKVIIKGFDDWSIFIVCVYHEVIVSSSFHICFLLYLLVFVSFPFSW